MTSLDEGLRALIERVVDEKLAKALADIKPTGDDLLTTGEAATYARIAQGTVRRWIREGRLEAHHAGRELRVRRADLEALLRGSKRAPARGRSADMSPEAVAKRLFGS